MKRLFCFAIILSLTTAAFAQTWQTLGPDNRHELGFQFTKLHSLATRGDTVLAAIEASFPPKTLAVKQFSGNTWDTVGSACNLSYNSYLDSVFLNLEHNQSAYAFYADSATGGKGSVKKMTGGVWTQLGTPGFTGMPIFNFSLKLGKSDTPFVLFTSMSITASMTVMKFNGTSWMTVGTITGTTATRPALGFDSSGSPFVAYANPNFINRATVVKWDGSNWITVSPSSGLSSSTATNIKVISNPISNLLYISFRDNALGNTVKAFDGNVWQTVGTTGFGPGLVDDLILNQSGVPYASLRDGDSAWAIKLNNANWQPVTSTLKSGAATRLALLYDSIPIMAHYPAAYSQRPVISKFTSVGWVKVGIYGFAEGGVSNLTQSSNSSISLPLKGLLAVVTSDGIPHVVFSDVENGGKLSFKKYVNGNWIYEGMPGFTNSSAQPLDLRKGKNDTLFLLYNDSGSWNYKLISLYNGNINTINSSLTNGAYPYNTSFCLDTAGVPYVAYPDPTNFNQTTIRNLVNGTWNVFASLVTTNPAQIEINRQNQIYAYYSPASSTYRLVQVSQGSVSAPITVPGKGFIKIAPNNDVYFTGLITTSSFTSLGGIGGMVGYWTYYTNRKLFKLSANNWIDLGATWGVSAQDNLPSDFDVSTSLVFDTNSVPYLASVKANLPILAARAPASWAFIPNQYTMTRAHNLDLSMGPDNKLIAVYSYGTAYALGIQSDTVPTNPAVVSPVFYCQGDSAAPLTAIGQNLQYALFGQPYSSTPITPSTNTPGTYNYFVKSVNGIFSSPSTLIEVTVLPKPVLSVSSANICEGDTVTVSVNTQSVGSYFWTATETVGGNTTTTSFSGSNSIPVTNPGTYSMVLNPYGCKSDTVSISSSPALQASINISGPAMATIGSPVTVVANTANAGAGYVIKWFRTGTQFATTLTDTVTYIKQAGTDYLKAVVENSIIPCVENDTSLILIISEQPMSVAAMSQSNVSVFPSPSSGKLTFKNDVAISYIEISNAQGQLIFTGQPNGKEYTIDLSERAPGMYYYAITCEGQKTYGKVMLK